MKSVNPRALCAVAALFAASGILFAQTPKSYSQLNAEHPGWMQIPGRLIRPDCVHEVPSGAQIELGRDNKPTGDVIMNGQVIAHYDSCPEESVETRHIGSQGEQDPGLATAGSKPRSGNCHWARATTLTTSTVIGMFHHLPRRVAR